MPSIEYDLITTAAAWLRERLPFTPKVGIILGTGLGRSLESEPHPHAISFGDVPGLIPTHVTSHAGKIIGTEIRDVPVLVFSGRIHYYEGHKMHEVIRPVRIMHALGCTHLIVTNASGGIHPSYKAGDIVLIRDQINFPQVTPLRGWHDERWGPRFPDMSEAYSKSWIAFVRQKVSLETGIYALTLGPQLETPAEYLALQKLGADLVGMSTVPEVIAARQLNMEVLGISVVANVCLLSAGAVPVTEAEIIDKVAAQSRLVREVINCSLEYCFQ